MLYTLHVTLILAGIVFSVGYALYQFLYHKVAVASTGGVLAIVFLAGAVFLTGYLRAVLRHGLRGAPKKSDDGRERQEDGE